jgi:hypothetical protein
MPNPRQLDGQQVEILGRNLVKASLIEAGVEVATPERDNGIDLLAYRWSQNGLFLAYPIQIKAASAFSFGMDRKYARIPRLIMVFVMNCRSTSESAIYAMTYAQMIQVGDSMAWTKTASWTERDGYSTRHPSPKLVALLERHGMDPTRWDALLADAG